MIKGKYIFKSNGKIIAEKDNLITTNGFLMINRYLAQSSIDWAGSLCVGAINTSPAITDKTLYYEMNRVPVTLKSYTKINPKYIVTNKQLATTTATINFKSTSTPILANAYTVQISGVDTALDGTWKITSFTTISAPTSSTLGEYQIVYTTSTAGTISSTVVTSQTAFLTVKLDASNNNVYNNEIIIKAALDADLAMQINEVGVIPLNVYTNASKDNYYLSDFSEVSTSDNSKSQWTISASQTNLQGIANIQGSATNPVGYLWPTGGTSVTFNVSSTNGMKVGNSVYITGTTNSIGTSLNAATGTITSINGNYQLVVNMSVTANSSGSSYAGYGGTISINSTTQSQVSNFGQFNILLPGGSSTTLSNLNINLSSYNSADKLMLLYYATGTMSGKTISVLLVDSAGNTYTCTSSSLTSTTAGWYTTIIPLTGFPSTGATIASITVLTSASSSSIYLDALKLISNSYWSAHPQVTNQTVYLSPEYQLTSRSIFNSPVIKNAGQQMDIEYHIQVT